jgi:hypothetical protein
MESSPKPRRPIFQPYVPVHRRNKVPIEETAVTPPPPLPTASPRASPKDDAEVKRRGRGQFRAPITEENGNDNGSANTSAPSLIEPENTAVVAREVNKERTVEDRTKNSENQLLFILLIGKASCGINTES